MILELENATDVVINEAYTHFSQDGWNYTRTCQPDSKSVAVTVRTSQKSSKISGYSEQDGAVLNKFGVGGPLNCYFAGSAADITCFVSEKTKTEKFVPSWVERTINDHIRHFYG
jgi:hypothetical protein